MHIIPNLSFLWHLQDHAMKCESCNASRSSSPPEAIARVAISNHQRRHYIDAAGAIKDYFESAERGVNRDCPEAECSGDRCTKSTMLPMPSKFIVVQLLRFRATENSAGKIDTEAKPFSSVEIETCQGICTYEVVATVEHVGTGLVGGIYLAYVKQNHNWLLCDDHRIASLGVNTNERTRNAYLVVLRTSELDDTSSPYS